jgi:hypothetical protein
VEASGYTDPVERPLLLEPLSDPLQDRHLAIGPFDAALAVGGHVRVADV